MDVSASSLYWASWSARLSISVYETLSVASSKQLTDSAELVLDEDAGIAFFYFLQVLKHHYFVNIISCFK